MRKEEKFYIERVKTLMKFHSRLILNDKTLTAKEKTNQMQIVEKILGLLPKEREAKGSER